MLTKEKINEKIKEKLNRKFQENLKIDPDIAEHMNKELDEFIKGKGMGFFKRRKMKKALINDARIAAANITEQRRKKIKNIPRNQRCPCNSGKKFKNCCLAKAQSNES